MASEIAKAFWETGDGWDEVDELVHQREDRRLAWSVMKTMLAYAYGEPVQRVESPPPTQNTLILNVGDLRQLIALLETRLALPQPVEEDDAGRTWWRLLGKDGWTGR